MAKDIVPRSRKFAAEAGASGQSLAAEARLNPEDWAIPTPAPYGPGAGRTVGLFVTCLVDLFRPSVGFAAARLLAAAGCTVVVPRAQTCCGQPAWNSGDRASARRIAKQVIRAFESMDDVVVPSGSCGGMIAHHFPEVLSGDGKWGPRAAALAEKTFELTSYLHDRLGLISVDTEYDGLCTYHDSCSSLREMKVKQQPRTLLASVEGTELRDMATPEVCCGFGGAFCVKYPEISTQMVADKTQDIINTGADTVVAGDMGCLLNIAGKLSREGSHIRCYHIAEILAGMSVPPIGTPLPEGAP